MSKLTASNDPKIPKAEAKKCHTGVSPVRPNIHATAHLILIGRTNIKWTVSWRRTPRQYSIYIELFSKVMSKRSLLEWRRVKLTYPRYLFQLFPRQRKKLPVLNRLMIMDSKAANKHYARLLSSCIPRTIELIFFVTHV